MFTKRIIVTILVWIVFLSFSFAQTNEAELKALMKQLGYEYSLTVTADIAEGQSAYYWKPFYTGNNYAILAFGEEGVNDVDLYLYDSDGSLLSKSLSSGQNYEILEYRVYASRDLKILIKNYDSYSSTHVYHLKFMIFYAQ